MNVIISEQEKNAAKCGPAEDLEIIDASVGSMSLGQGNMFPAEIQVKTNNLIEIIDASPGSLSIGLGGNMHPAEIQVKINNKQPINMKYLKNFSGVHFRSTLPVDTSTRLLVFT